MIRRFWQRLASPKLFLTVVLGLATYFALAGGRYSILDARRADARLEQLRTDIGEAQRRVDSLEARIVDLQEDDVALERLARERYGFIRDGEYLYRVSIP